MMCDLDVTGTRAFRHALCNLKRPKSPNIEVTNRDTPTLPSQRGRRRLIVVLVSNPRLELFVNFGFHDSKRS